MKASFISDLHIDLDRKEPVSSYQNKLLELLAKEKSDILVIGGDISNDYQITLPFVEKLQKASGIPVYFVPGNHDYWQDRQRKNTWKIYSIYRNHPQSLIESPVQLNKEYTLVGHSAWYNHAIYNKDKYNEKEVEKGKFRWTYWQDKVKTNWKMTDQELSKYFAELIQTDLEKVETNQIILQTHVGTIPEFTMPMPHKIFDFFNAYMMTDDLKDFQREYPISHHFMGHIHFRAQIKKEGSLYISNSLGYRREWRTQSLRKELADSLITIDI